MRTRQRIFQVILFFLLQSTYAQVLLETVYVSQQKTAKVFPAVRYYFYPNLQAYYDICTSLYIYKKDGEWVTAPYISANYRGYSLSNNKYVLLEGFTEDKPYIFLDEHKKKYHCNFSSKRTKDNALVQN